MMMKIHSNYYKLKFSKNFALDGILIFLKEGPMIKFRILIDISGLWLANFIAMWQMVLFSNAFS